MGGHQPAAQHGGRVATHQMQIAPMTASSQVGQEPDAQHAEEAETVQRDQRRSPGRAAPDGAEAARTPENPTPRTATGMPARSAYALVATVRQPWIGPQTRQSTRRARSRRGRSRSRRPSARARRWRSSGRRGPCTRRLWPGSTPWGRHAPRCRTVAPSRVFRPPAHGVRTAVSRAAWIVVNRSS